MNGNDTTRIYGKIKYKTEIEGYACAADWIKLTNDWEIIEFCLSDDFESGIDI